MSCGKVVSIQGSIKHAYYPFVTTVVCVCVCARVKTTVFTTFALQCFSRNLSPAPDLVLWKPINPGVLLLSRGVFTPLTHTYQYERRFGRHYLSKATCLMRTQFAFYGITCLTRLLQFATSFATFEENMYQRSSD